MSVEQHVHACVTRREFLYAGAAALSGLQIAPKYDLIIKGGRVLDASQSIDRVMDVAVQNGKIAVLLANIAESDAAQLIDARGKLVTPGLVDIHVHAAEMPPAHCLSTGVTTLADAGSRGLDGIEELVGIAKTAPNRVRILINLSRRGVAAGELLDFANVDVPGVRRAIEAHRNVIIGIKARLSRTVAGERDLDAIRRAHEVTVPLGLPLMVHIGNTASPLPQILTLLRPGDIVTHVYAPPPNGIFDDNGRILPQVLDARRRGIVFDIGNGRNGHITWEIAERALQQGFLPDTISSDLTEPGRMDRVFDFPTVLSKFLMLGMPVDQVIARGTLNAARAVPAFKECGTLRVGASADVAVFELLAGDFEFVDNENTKRIGHQKLMPRAVVMQGKRSV